MSPLPRPLLCAAISCVSILFAQASLGAPKAAPVASPAPAVMPTPAPTPKPGLTARVWQSVKDSPAKTANALAKAGSATSEAVGDAARATGRIITKPFSGMGKKSEPEIARATWKRMEMRMETAPLPLKLSEARKLQVTLRLTNNDKKLVRLDFPTTQRMEVEVSNPDGKVIERWSEDQRFDNDPSLVTVNSGERLEYIATVSTRDFVAGKTYRVEAWLPRYPELRAQLSVVAEP